MNWPLVGSKTLGLIRRTILFAGGIAVIAGAAQLFAPQAVHGLVSALVTVANTRTNPVPVDDGTAAEAHMDGCFINNNNGGFYRYTDCFISVPAGRRFVIQTASFRVITDTSVGVVDGALNPSVAGADNFIYFNVPFTGPDGDGNNHFAASQATTLYADPNRVQCSVSFGTAPNNSTLECTVVGYLVNLP